jgi:adenylate kinase
MREDDNPEALAARLRDYHEKTQPIIELFERKENVLHVDAKREIAVIQDDIRSRLGLPR